MSLGMDFVGYQKKLKKDHGLPDEQAMAMALKGYRENVRLFDRISGSTSSKEAIYRSAVVAAAAGNESDRPQYSVAVAPPAAAEFFVSVGAVGPGNGGTSYPMAKFSNDGAMFVAPGVDIWSSAPGGGFVAKDGTSMATPHVAGVAALWAEKLGKKFRAASVMDMMTKSALELPHISTSDARFGMIQAP